MPSANSGVSATRDPDLVRCLNQALKLKSRKQYRKAKEILLALAAEHVNSAAVFGTLGDVYWRLGSVDEAIPCFLRASQLAPKSELVSLGLFHTLWETGQTRRAMKEME